MPVDLDFLWSDALQAFLISLAGFFIALWYMRSRIVDKKNINKGFLRYFHDLFPIGMMLFGVYSSYAVERLFGCAIMTISTFVYVVTYVAPSIDKYDNVHRATILSLGYTRQEYAIRYLFPKTRKIWFAASLNFFVGQWASLSWFDLIKRENLARADEMILVSSLFFMAVGILISVLKNHSER